MQPEFTMPDFLLNSSPEEIHERMMSELPADIDDMPGGFPYDFTMPAAQEKSEFINFHLARAVMIAFPQFAWDEWLDLHGRQVNLTRHEPQKAAGAVVVTGTAGAVIAKGTVFCTPATDTGPSIEYETEEEAAIGEDGTVRIEVRAVQAGTESNVAANTVSLMAKPDKAVTSVNNPERISGGTERESDDDYFDRIDAEYANSMTYLGNDVDYKRWAKQAGAGDCYVMPAAEGPGTVKLVLVDTNGQPANEQLVRDVYNYIVSPEDRSKRLLPTGTAKLICEAATTILIDFEITGLVYDETASIDSIKKDFTEAVKAVYAEAREDGILRYNDVRPIITDIPGVEDFDEFLMQGSMKNIKLSGEDYPETGNLDFS